LSTIFRPKGGGRNRGRTSPVIIPSGIGKRTGRLSEGKKRKRGDSILTSRLWSGEE